MIRREEGLREWMRQNNGRLPVEAGRRRIKKAPRTASRRRKPERPAARGAKWLISVALLTNSLPTKHEQQVGKGARQCASDTARRNGWLSRARRTLNRECVKAPQRFRQGRALEGKWNMPVQHGEIRNSCLRVLTSRNNTGTPISALNSATDRR